MIEPWSPEKRAAILEEHRREMAARPEREQRNAALALALSDRQDILAYRGNVYVVPPLPYAEGFQLERLWGRLNRLTSKAQQREKDNEGRRERSEPELPEEPIEDLEEMLDIMKQGIALFWRAIKPVPLGSARTVIGRRWEVYKYMLRMQFRPKSLVNPFQYATEAEIGELFAFFYRCRTRSSVRHPTHRIQNDRHDLSTMLKI